MTLGAKTEPSSEKVTTAEIKEISTNIIFKIDGNLKIVDEMSNGNGTQNPTDENKGRSDFTISTPYVGTFSLTIQVDETTISESVEKYIYIVGKELSTETQSSITIENLEADSSYNITVIGITTSGKHLISTMKVKTEPKVYLFNNGDQCISVTGGWEAVAKSDTSDSKAVAKAPNLSFDSTNNCMKISITGPNSYSGTLANNGIVRTKNTINLKEYNKVCVKYTASLSRYSSACSFTLLGENKSDEGFEKYGDSLCYTKVISTPTIEKRDVSSNKYDDFCFGLRANCSSSSGSGYTTSATIYEVWLEK